MMLKKNFHKILFCLTTLGITSLQAAHLLQQEGKNDGEETNFMPQLVIEYYDHTLRYYSDKKIDNIVNSNDLKDEQKDLENNYVAKKLKNKQGAIFFMIIVSNTQTKALSKFFFFNRDPNIEIGTVENVQKSRGCHVISHTTPKSSPHIIFQVLGWMEQNLRIYTPVFIYSNCALCITCHALAFNLFKLRMPTNKQGCRNSNIQLENECPLAQQYINSVLTLPLAKKLLLPTLRLQCDNKIKLLKDNHNNITQNLLRNNKQIQKRLLANNNRLTMLRRLLKDRIELRCSPLNSHEDGVKSVAISSDNRYIVSGSWDYTIRIWRLNTGKQLAYSPLKGHKWQVYSVAITENNKYIVSGSWDSTIRIWDIKTGREVAYSPLKGHTSYIYSVVVTTDNKYIVSGSYDQTIRIWNLKTGQELSYSPLNGHKNLVWSVAVTKDNKYIVSSGLNGTIRIWDIKTGQELSYSPLTGHKYSVESVAISSDNTYIISGDCDKTIRIWDFKTGQELSYSPLTGHKGGVLSVAISSDNKYIVSGSDDNTIRIWDFKTGKEVSYSPLNGHKHWVFSVAISSDNRYIISGSHDKTIRIWDWKLLRCLHEDEHKEDNEVFDID